MLSLRNSFVPAVSIIAACFCMSSSKAQNTGCYTLASLQGAYAVVGTYTANIAISLGTRNFDGAGNMTGTFVVNEPTPGSTTGDRTIVTGTQLGTYTVNCDGTGVITRALTASNGIITSNQMDDFIITGATVNGGQVLATTLVDAVRTPSAIVPGGIFLTRAYTRLPSAGCYSFASLQGSYAVIGNYGDTVAAALATRSVDGNGNLTGNFKVNEPTAGSTTGQRTIVTGTQKGTYAVNCDGTGVITRILTQADGTTTPQSDDFIVTGGMVNGSGQLIATSIVDAQRTPSAIVPGGIFLARTHTRLPNIPAGSGTTPPATGVTIVVTGPGGATTTGNTFQTTVSTVSLSATQSTSSNPGSLSYSWTVSPGYPSAAINGGNTATPVVQLPIHGTYQFTLTVTDATGVMATTTVTVQYV